MKSRFVIVVWYWDGSGLVQALGPYASKEEAEAARGRLKDLPVFEDAPSRWDIIPCTNFEEAA